MLQRAARAKEEARQTAERARAAEAEFEKIVRTRTPVAGGSQGTALVLATPVIGEGSFRLARTAREEKMQQMYGSALALAKASSTKAARGEGRRPSSAGVTATRRVQV